MNINNIDRNIERSEKEGHMIGAILCLLTGLLFLVPGIIFFIKIVGYLLNNTRQLNLPITFITIFMLSIGIVLVLLAVKFITGNIATQKISVPILIFASLFFIGSGTAFLLLGYVFRVMPTDYPMGRAIGVAYIIGFMGLWAARKRMKKNKRIVPRKTKSA